MLCPRHIRLWAECQAILDSLPELIECAKEMESAYKVHFSNKCPMCSSLTMEIIHNEH